MRRINCVRLTSPDLIFRITPPVLAEGALDYSLTGGRMALNSLNGSSKALFKSPITIMSFNIRCDTEHDKENRWLFRSKACIEMIRQTNPSVLGIQEGMRHQVDELVANLPEYDKVGVGRDDGALEGEACAVFYLRSQFTLLEEGTFWLSETPAKPSLGWDARCRRIVTWVHLQPKDNEEPFFLFNTHLDHMGEVARIKSAELLVQSIRELTSSKSAVFITGDFNATIEDSSLTPILEIFCEARRTAPQSDLTLSFNGWGDTERWCNIDHIFYAHAQIWVFKTANEDYGVPYISDHYPIMADFRY